jgi:hypothetical protein
MRERNSRYEARVGVWPVARVAELEGRARMQGPPRRQKKNTERKEESKRARQANKSSRVVARGNEKGDIEVKVDKG